VCWLFDHRVPNPKCFNCRRSLAHVSFEITFLRIPPVLNGLYPRRPTLLLSFAPDAPAPGLAPGVESGCGPAPRRSCSHSYFVYQPPESLLLFGFNCSQPEDCFACPRRTTPIQTPKCTSPSIFLNRVKANHNDPRHHVPLVPCFNFLPIFLFPGHPHQTPWSFAPAALFQTHISSWTH